jgi:hypothetical protein
LYCFIDFLLVDVMKNERNMEHSALQLNRT